MRANEIITEKWSQKYKSSINCSHPKGFSQRAHCAGKKKHNESVEMEMVCEDCGMCKTHGNINEIAKGAKDSNGYTRCWPGKHAAGTKKGKNGGQVRNCVPNESQGVAEGSENNNPIANKIFFARSNKAPKGWSYDHVGFITQDGKQIQMSGHKGNDVYVTNAVTDDPEFPKQNIKIVSLSKPVSVPTTNSVGAENCGTFVANVLQANGIKGIDTQKIYSVFKKPHEQGVAEGSELSEEFDLIESAIDNLALRNGVDAEVIWEDLESLTDDELYVFATTTTIMETEAWQKANKRDKTDGMSKKAVKTYRREHPGSKLQTAVTTKPSKLKKGSKASKRRKSYCSRSRGQMKMHNISCAKTPDKAICKARRRWNC